MSRCRSNWRVSAADSRANGLSRRCAGAGWRGGEERGARGLRVAEPFAALDEITRRQLADDLLALWAEQRPAIVFVTHNVEEAVYMASRVVVMSPGPGRIAGEVAVDAPAPRP